ncbi:DUF742 domain-containing protein [Actinoplanes sp. TRM 88003]|uniref:DUF742 domain-containing protein n=1 Tax=Paractinoplanes aksuensis TaxID=2939490 RepID=A0ABT1DWH4_9ACTN|nr:DUF742 domain-containing protein [Actinoplanes aksuensis]MCO8275222.1 DUF742 domain-containing protein [Actinoplanes aksuensis]
MSFETWDGDDESAAGRFVPLYVLVNGRTAPRDSTLDLATQVVALSVDTRRLEPEYLEIVRQCAGWISVAEIGAYLKLPLAIAKVMVDVLVEQGYLAVGTPAQQRIFDKSLLDQVIAGLERL